MLLKATAATRVFTKTPLARASETMATIVAGAVAIAAVARRAEKSSAASQRKKTLEKTRSGVIVDSAMKSRKRRAPALRRRRTLRCAPTVTAISPRAKCVKGCSAWSASSPKRSSPAVPRATPARIWPVMPGRRTSLAAAPETVPTSTTTARVRKRPRVFEAFEEAQGHEHAAAWAPIVVGANRNSSLMSVRRAADGAETAPARASPAAVGCRLALAGTGCQNSAPCRRR